MRITRKRTRARKKKIPTTKKWKLVSTGRQTSISSSCLVLDQDLVALEKLGSESNAIIWPEPKFDEDEDIDEVEHPNNQRLMRIGMLCSFHGLRAYKLIKCHG